MPAKRQRLMLPIWGYVALNGAFLLFLAAAYALGSRYAEANSWELTGVFPVMVVCYLAFTIVCIFDAAYDRLSREKSTPPKAPTQPLNTSRDLIRKID